ncbi:MAG: DUF3179 domain-containing protein [Thermoleophilia bacterium]|nr:DUF3179 domain-containing protein [Thermoleophilia bacterium]
MSVAVSATLLAACGGSGSDGSGSGAQVSGGDQQAATDVPFATGEWDTDFSKSSVDFDEIRSGGPGKDDIPALDDPGFVSVAEADEYLSPREPVAVLERNGTSKAYPIQILTWHEIVNDEIAGEPVAVTFCPLCNSTVAFSREVDGRVLDFGTTGKLRRSDLVMYDGQTESWWQQLTAEAIIGELTGTRLEVLPSQILSWEQFKRAAPDGQVLSRDTGFNRDYGTNPYADYDRPDSEPFLYDKETDDRLPPKERVSAVRTGDESAVVYPFSRLADETIVQDQIKGMPVVVFYDPRVASALDDAEIAQGEETGGAAVFKRKVAGRTLAFESAGDGIFKDLETGSTWNIRGRATDGDLKGEQLKQIPSDDQFWFALAAFFPDAEVRG